MEEKTVYNTEMEIAHRNGTNGPRVVAADSVDAEEVPTVSVESLLTINALQPEVSVRPVIANKALRRPEPLVAQPAEYQRSFREWVQIWRDGMRLDYLSLALMPVLLGSVLAWTETVSEQARFGHFHVLHFLGIIISIFLLQIGANLLNDYYDHLRGIDISSPLGPGELIQQGLIKPTHVLVIGLALLGAGSLLGIIFATTGGPLVFIFSVIGLACAYFYSATRFSLASLALGEITIFCIFGPLITLGAYMVQTGSFSFHAFTYSIPLGLLATAVIHVNNMRDMEGDEYAGKYTLAALLGFGWSRFLYIVLLLAAYAMVVNLALPHGAPHLLLITLWTLPTLVVAITGILRTVAPVSLHTILRQTQRLQTAFALLLLVALVGTALLSQFPLPHIHIPQLLHP